MQVTPELCTLLMFVPKAHPELQSMLINVQHFRPTWVLGGASATLRELYFTSRTAGKWEDESDKPDKLDEPLDLDAMHCTKSALGKVSLPPKAHFIPGKVVHVQFDGGS